VKEQYMVFVGVLLVPSLLPGKENVIDVWEAEGFTKKVCKVGRSCYGSQKSLRRKALRSP
jgi:hypothetical protein